VFNYHSRIKKLQQKIKPGQIILLSNSTDVHYFTGFIHLVPSERESFCLITQDQCYLFHAGFSPYLEYKGINAIASCSLKRVTQKISELTQKQRLNSLLIDKANFSVAEYELLLSQINLPTTALDRKTIWEIRLFKDEQEIASLTNASQITAKVMQETIAMLKTGITEIEVKDIAENLLKTHGSQQPAFPTIVAFGKNTALPHHQPTTKKLTSETPVLIDLGATIDGYKGDMTRTIWLGQSPNPNFLEVQQIVKGAYQAAIDKIESLPQTGQLLLAKDLDQAARSYIDQKGYGDNFIHTTGHGLGLEIHENLSLNWKNKQEIKPPMVLTIEPGIYLKGEFGFRYENTILVTDDKGIELTTPQ
jgi:Xaa-Pro aminopeptidase